MRTLIIVATALTLLMSNNQILAQELPIECVEPTQKQKRDKKIIRKCQLMKEILKDLQEAEQFTKELKGLSQKLEQTLDSTSKVIREFNEKRQRYRLRRPYYCC